MYFDYNVDDRVLFAGHNIMRKLDSESVAQIAKDMLKQKSDFRRLIDQFEKLTPAKKLYALNKFYKFNDVEFRRHEARAFLKQGCSETDIIELPVQLFYTTNHFNFVKAKALKVMAVVGEKKVKSIKQPVPVNTIYKLIKKGVIRVIDVVPEGTETYTRAAVLATGAETFFNKPVLYPEGRVTFSDFDVMKMQNNRPFTQSLVRYLGSEHFKEDLIKDYTSLYVPMYKEALGRLRKMYANSKIMSQKECEKMYNDYINKAVKLKNEEMFFDKTEKLIIDQTRGR